MATLTYVLTQALGLSELPPDLKSFACDTNFPEDETGSAIEFLQKEIPERLQSPVFLVRGEDKEDKEDKKEAKAAQLRQRSSSCSPLSRTLNDKDYLFKLHLAIIGSLQAYWNRPRSAATAPAALVRRFEIIDFKEAVGLLDKECETLSEFDMARLVAFFCAKKGANGLILTQSSSKRPTNSPFALHMYQVIMQIQKLGGDANIELASQLLCRCFLYLGAEKKVAVPSRNEAKVVIDDKRFKTNLVFLERIDWVKFLPLLIGYEAKEVTPDSKDEFLSKSNIDWSGCLTEIFKSQRTVMPPNSFQYFLDHFFRLLDKVTFSSRADADLMKIFITLCQKILDSLENAKTLEDKQKCYSLIEGLNKVVCRNEAVLGEYTDNDPKANSILHRIFACAQIAPDIRCAAMDRLADIRGDREEKKESKSEATVPLTDEDKRAERAAFDLGLTEHPHIIAAHRVAMIFDAAEADHERAHGQKRGIYRNPILTRLVIQEVASIPEMKSKDGKLLTNIDPAISQNARSDLLFAPLFLLYDLARDGGDAKDIDNCFRVFGKPTKPMPQDFVYFYGVNRDHVFAKWNVPALQAVIIASSASFFRLLSESPLLIDYFGISTLAEALARVRCDMGASADTKSQINQYLSSLGAQAPSASGEAKSDISIGVMKQDFAKKLQAKYFECLSNNGVSPSVRVEAKEVKVDADAERKAKAETEAKEKARKEVDQLRKSTVDFYAEMAAFASERDKDGRVRYRDAKDKHCWDALQGGIKLWQNASKILSLLSVDEQIEFVLKVLEYQRGISGTEKTPGFDKLIQHIRGIRGREGGYKSRLEEIVYNERVLSESEQNTLELRREGCKTYITITALYGLWSNFGLTPEKCAAEAKRKADERNVRFLRERASANLLEAERAQDESRNRDRSGSVSPASFVGLRGVSPSLSSASPVTASPFSRSLSSSPQQQEAAASMSLAATPGITPSIVAPVAIRPSAIVSGSSASAVQEQQQKQQSSVADEENISRELKVLDKDILDLRQKQADDKKGIFEEAGKQFVAVFRRARVLPGSDKKTAELKVLHDQTRPEIKAAPDACRELGVFVERAAKISAELKIFGNDGPVQTALGSAWNLIRILNAEAQERMQLADGLSRSEDEVLLSLEQNFIAENPLSRLGCFSIAKKDSDLEQEIERAADSSGLLTHDAVLKRRQEILILNGRLEALEGESKAAIETFRRYQTTMDRAYEEEHKLCTDIGVFKTKCAEIRLLLKNLPREAEKELKECVRIAPANSAMACFNDSTFCDDQNKVILAGHVFERVGNVRYGDVAYLRSFNLGDLFQLFQVLPARNKPQVALNLLELFERNGIRLEVAQRGALEHYVATETLVVGLRGALDDEQKAAKAAQEAAQKAVLAASSSVVSDVSEVKEAASSDAKEVKEAKVVIEDKQAQLLASRNWSRFYAVMLLKSVDHIYDSDLKDLTTAVGCFDSNETFEFFNNLSAVAADVRRANAAKQKLSYTMLCSKQRPADERHLLALMQALHEDDVIKVAILDEKFFAKYIVDANRIPMRTTSEDHELRCRIFSALPPGHAGDVDAARKSGMAAVLLREYCKAPNTFPAPDAKADEVRITYTEFVKAMQDQKAYTGVFAQVTPQALASLCGLCTRQNTYNIPPKNRMDLARAILSTNIAQEFGFDTLYNLCITAFEDLEHCDVENARRLLRHPGAVKTFSYRTLHGLWEKAAIGRVSDACPPMDYGRDDKHAVWQSYDGVRQALCLNVNDAAVLSSSFTHGKLFSYINIPSSECIPTCLLILFGDGIRPRTKESALKKLLGGSEEESKHGVVEEKREEVKESKENKESKEEKRADESKGSEDARRRELTLEILHNPEKLIALCTAATKETRTDSGIQERNAAFNEVRLVARTLHNSELRKAMESAIRDPNDAHRDNVISAIGALASTYQHHAHAGEIQDNDSDRPVFLYCRNMSLYYDDREKEYESKRGVSKLVHQCIGHQHGASEAERKSNMALWLFHKFEDINYPPPPADQVQRMPAASAAISGGSDDHKLHIVVERVTGTNTAQVSSALNGGSGSVNNVGPSLASNQTDPHPQPQRRIENANNISAGQDGFMGSFDMDVLGIIDQRIDDLVTQGAAIPEGVTVGNFDTHVNELSIAQRKLLGLQALRTKLFIADSNKRPKAEQKHIIDEAREKYDLDATSCFSPWKSTTTKMLSKISENIDRLPEPVNDNKEEKKEGNGAPYAQGDTARQQFSSVVWVAANDTTTNASDGDVPSLNSVN